MNSNKEQSMQRPENRLQTKIQKRLKTTINIDCIKNCLLDGSLWAFAFYQQNPSFVGGIMVISTNDLLLLQKIQPGHDARYLQLGPIMHIQWLSMSNVQIEEPQKTDLKYYILAAARCDQAIICSYNPKESTLTVQKRIQLQKGIFCLYCDWRTITKAQQKDTIIATAVVSTSQSSVFNFTLKITPKQIQIGQIVEYKKHQYAVWACRINPDASKNQLLVVGDQVDCLYLYDLVKKQLIGKNKKAHSQGICEVIWKSNQTVMTGSFDGSFAQISVNNFGVVLKRVQLGGTIWRIIPMKRSNKETKNLLICNSSQKKFQIYNTQRSQIIWDSVDEHTNLAYAADYKEDILITASFYDQEVRIWTLP